MPQPGVANLRPSDISSPTSPMASERSASPAASLPSSPANVAAPLSTAGSGKSTKSQSSEDSEQEVIYKDARDGVEWILGLHGWEPRWTYLPKLEAIESVCRDALKLAPEDKCTVTFYAAGSFNRVYLVQSQKGIVVTQSIMRISLPVEPSNKSECEVTTMRFVDRHTMIPVPRVIAFNDDDDNEIGFEWILMEFVTGTPLYKRWRRLSLEQKIYVTEQIASFHSQLFQQEFKGIGSLHPRSSDKEGGPKPGMHVALHYFIADHFDYDVPRGPFRTSYDWIKSVLQTQEIDQTNDIKNSDDKETREDAKYRLWSIRKLKWLLPKILPEVMHPTERTVLWHEDLHEQNILINDDCKVTGILDWEFAFAAPAWMATKFPAFLRSHVREQEPNPTTYMPYKCSINVSQKEGTLTEEERKEYEAAELDNDGKPPVYWDHLEAYEKTQMRKVYAAKMAELWPEYETLARHSELKNDFVDAVIQANAALPCNVSKILVWVANISVGKFPRFRTILTSGLGVSDDDTDPMFQKHGSTKRKDDDDDEIRAGYLSSDDEDEDEDGGDEDEEESELGGEDNDLEEIDNEDGDEKVKERGVEVAEEDDGGEEPDEETENKNKVDEKDEGEQCGHVMKPVQAFSAPATTKVDGDAQTSSNVVGIIAFVALIVYLSFVV